MFKKNMRVRAYMIAFLSFVLLSATAFGQGSSAASLGGTITDASGGVLRGATVAVANVDTGIVSRTTTNNSGVYNFPSLPIGNYEVTVEASGFTPAKRTGLRLGVGSSANLSISMVVAGSITEIEVSGTVDSVMLEAGSSTGTVMQEDVLHAIPLVGNNIMEILNVFAGVSQVTDPVWGAQSQQFAGVNANMINVTRDGLTVTEVRQPSGVAGNTNINQEMIGEFKMILSAVDAEMGRGAGQVQMTTKSGSNTFHGSGVWNIQNTALDAREFSDKRNNVLPSWRNLNNYIVTASGPVVKNKTFFFATWEQQISRDKVMTNIKAMTPCARKGIYRYIAGWIPAARNENDTYNPFTGSMPSVDINGKPIERGSFYSEYDTSAVYQLNSQLQIRSVFGNWAAGVRETLLADKGPNGVYGDCENIAFNPTLNGGTDTSNFYGANSLVRGSYWGGDFTSGGVYRNAYDPTGFVQRFTFGTSYSAGTVRMPDPNNYNMGDGLNLAGHRYHSRVSGSGATIYGSGGDPERKSITVKIDHNINNDHRLSGTYTQEDFYVGEYHGLMQTVTWPEEYGGYTGNITRKPKSLAFSMTSTLRPTLLNEARFGFALSDAWMVGAQFSEKTGDKMRSVLENLMPPSQTLGRQTIVGVGEGSMLFHADPMSYTTGGSHPLGGKVGLPLKWGGPDGRWTGADTVTWMRGAHSFKGGAEYRWQRSRQDYNGARGFVGFGSLTDEPAVFGGLTGSTSTGAVARRDAVLAQTMSGWNDVYRSSDPKTGSGNFTVPREMMTYFSGAISQIRQYFYQVNDGGNLRWNNASIGETVYSMDLASQELSFFFKDDWKITRDLTLNLGVRYEYYGIPYERNGYTPRIAGDVLQNAFGISKGDNWNNWIRNRNYVDAPRGIVDNGGNITLATSEIAVPDPVTIFQQVGPGSKNPGISAWNKDLNNFAPHLGFAWQLPWFGKGQTTLRGGWSMSYSLIDNFNNFGVILADVSAANTSNERWYTGFGDGGNYAGGAFDTLYYMDLEDLNRAGRILNNNGLLDAPTDVTPFTPNVVGQLTGGSTVIDNYMRNPYVHSFNLSVTRNIGRAITVDVRYIGSLGRDLKQANVGTGINSVDYINNGLYVELEKIRRNNSYQSPLINSLIPAGLLYAPQDYLTGISDFTLTGTDQMRAYGSPVANNLAIGNFLGVATTLSTTNGNINRPEGVAGMQSGLLARAGCLPEDRQVAGDLTTRCTKGTPWNFYVANPQFSSIGVYHNNAISNYHSMQAQVTMRPTRGLNFQATYTWSRNLDNNTWTNYMGDYREDRDYYLSGQHRSHTFNTYGSWELPFGSNGFFFRGATGVFKKAIEGWQLSWITTMSSGAPASVTGQSTLWSRSWPILVRPDLWDDKAGNSVWNNETNGGGTYFGDKYIKVIDPLICNASNLAGGLGGYCMSTFTAPTALALSSGKVDTSGNMLPATYDKDYQAADGVTYRQGDPIIIFRNADQSAGANAMGNYKPARITGPGRFTFDLAASKSIEFMEGKLFEIRVDAQNILNHASMSNGNSVYNSGRVVSVSAPSFDISSSWSTFGRFTTKGGHRTFQARLSLRF